MKMCSVFPSLISVALLLGGTYCVQAQNVNDGVQADTGFISKNVRDNMKEIRFSKMALDKSTDQRIKDLASQMVTDHTRMLQDLRKLHGSDSGTASTPISRPGDTASASNELDIVGNKSSSSTTDTAGDAGMDMEMTDDTSGHHVGMHNGIRKLQDASGKEFDGLWVSQMLRMHEMKLSELKSAMVTDSQLKTIVTDAIPKITAHRDRLAELRKNSGSDNKDMKMKSKKKSSATGSSSAAGSGSQ